MSLEQPKKNTTPLVFIQFLKVDELAELANFTQCGQPSPFDQTAMKGSPFLSAYCFALVNPPCHRPGTTAAEEVIRLAISLDVSPARDGSVRRHANTSVCSAFPMIATPFFRRFVSVCFTGKSLP